LNIEELGLSEVLLVFGGALELVRRRERLLEVKRLHFSNMFRTIWN